jgi:hypothetical protein
MYRSLSSIALASALVGCAPQLSPTQLVGSESSDVAVIEFLYAGRALAAVYGFDFQFAYEAPPPKSPREAFAASAKYEIPYTFTLRAPESALLYGRDKAAARDYFIRAGHHASQILCRNYLSGLRDRNEYFEFLQQEFKIASNLTGVLLTLTYAAEKSKDIFTQVTGSANLGVDAYQTFRFLAPEIETILPLVEAAQVAMRDYYTVGKGIPATFAGALNAVSKIEYQCSRSGIRNILTKTLVQSQPKYTVVDGVLYAHKAEEASPVDKTIEKPAVSITGGK